MGQALTSGPMSLVGHSRQFSCVWAASGCRTVSEGPSAALRASALALLNVTGTGVSKLLRSKFTDHERTAIKPILSNKVLRFVLRLTLVGTAQVRLCPTRLDAPHARGMTTGNYFFDNASRAFVSFSSSSFCWLMRSAIRSWFVSPEAAAACSISCLILSRRIAIRSLSSDSESDVSLLIMHPPGDCVVWTN